MTLLRAVFLRFILILFILIETMGAESDSSKVHTFVATKNWQVIPEGQGVPQGLHVRINLQTGLKEAKLLDNDKEADDRNQNIVQTDEKVFEHVDNPSALLEVPTLANSDKLSSEPDVKFDHAELKLALKKIKNDAKQSSQDSSGLKKTYEQIKKEMEELQHSIKSEYEIIQDLLAEYKSAKEDSVKIDILLDLEYYVHQYDNAMDFAKMDGFRVTVLPSLNSTDSGLRSAAAFLMGSACQSNLQVQISALEVGAVPLLIRLVALDSSKQVQARALYALSSIIRHFPYAQKAFFDEGGISAFSQLFQTDSSELQKLQLKIITLLSDIITEKSMLAQHLQEQQDSLPLSELSPEDALERRNSETKLSQYNSFDTEKIIVEQGFCNLIPRLLTQLKMDDDDHDVVEKVIQAMLPLRPHCQKDFLSVRPIISILTDRYRNLSLEEQRTGNPQSENYFTKLYNMCQNFYSPLHREEL